MAAILGNNASGVGGVGGTLDSSTTVGGNQDDLAHQVVVGTEIDREETRKIEAILRNDYN